MNPLSESDFNREFPQASLKDGSLYLMNQLGDLSRIMVDEKGPRTLDPALLSLTNRFIQIFRSKETEMDRTGYPGASWHKKLHHDFIFNLSFLAKLYHEGAGVEVLNTHRVSTLSIASTLQTEMEAFDRYLSEVAAGTGGSA